MGRPGLVVYPRRLLAAVARGGSYLFTGGGGSRTGSGLIFPRMPFNISMRGESGYRSSAIVVLSSRVSAVVSSSDRSSFMT
jgi:hypothetical protein